MNLRSEYLEFTLENGEKIKIYIKKSNGKQHIIAIDADKKVKIERKKV